MRITIFRMLAVSLMVALVACGGGGSSSPTAPAPTPIPVLNFAGTWSGTYVLTSCGHTGDFASGDFCGVFTIGSFLPMTLSLSQTGSSVTGTLLQGTILTSVSGSVDSAGHLILTGTGASSGFALQMVGWDTTQSGSRMSGSWNTRWTGVGWIGYAQVINTLSSVAKTSSSGAVPLAAAAPSQPVFGGGFEDVLARMR